MYISNGNYLGFVEQFRQHFHSFMTRVGLLRKEQKYEELKWRANWMRIGSVLIEMHPPSMNEPNSDL